MAYVRQDDDEVEFNRQEEWDELPIEYDLVHRLDEALNSFKYRTRRRDQRNNAAVVKVAAFHYIFVIFVIGFSLIFAL